MNTPIETRGRRPIRWNAVAVVVALVLGAAALGGAAQATTNRQSTGTYADRTGDSGLAPDISNVTISSSPDGQVLFRVTANVAAASEAWTVLLLDTDVNEATGSPNTLGADFMFEVDETDRTYWFGRWNGSDWEETPYDTVSVFSGSAGVTISVNRSELANTGEFNFWARTGSGDFAEGRYDDAPDDGTWNYAVAAGGPNIEAVLVATKPSSGPKAGRPFSVSPAGLRVKSNGGSPILPQPDTYSCRATLGGRALVGTATGGCNWRVPAKARGKVLRVVLTVNYQGATKSVPFVYRVS
jgi:hypothetical protein